MIGFAALLAYMSQWEKVNHAYTVSLSFVFLKVPKTLEVNYNPLSINELFNSLNSIIWKPFTLTSMPLWAKYKTDKVKNAMYELLEAAGRLLPFHDIEHANWQVAQGKNKENHHQHAGRLASSSDLFDLSANCARSNPHGLPEPCVRSRALDGPPLPLQHRSASRNLLIERGHTSDTARGPKRKSGHCDICQ